VLADPVRGRLLLLLEGHELTVSELCVVLQLPQSTVSRQLKLLLDSGWISSRRNGTSRFYTLVGASALAEGRRLWTVVREQVAGTPAAAEDERRLRSVLARRQSRSQQFFASAAGEWDRLREELFGRSASLVSMLGLLDEHWDVADLGCGTGQIASTLSPFVHRVIAVDRSAEMLLAARRRLRECENVEIRRGDLERLPIDDESVDAALLILVLHYVPEPAAALTEAGRVLRPGGRLVVADMMPHDREEYRQKMGHVWLGFSEERILQDLQGAGFESARLRALPAEPAAKGPSLFVASATRAAASGRPTARRELQAVS
jgi:ArsR family transcriptional regulator